MSKKILIVEDEPQIIEFLEVALKLNNYAVFKAINGRDGLEKANRYLPDLIISDVMMPEMDGYQMLSELKKSPDTATIPTLIVSAKSDRGDVRYGMNLGADDYLTKPFDIEDLLNAVESKLKKTQAMNEVISDKMEGLRSSIRSTLPHEIRTPLNIILGYSNILLKKNDYSCTEDVREMISGINYGAKRLHSLFENYLLYASLEVLAINKEEVLALKSKTAVESRAILWEIANKAAEKYERLEDIVICADAADLKMSEFYFSKVISELCDNAFKFSKAGTFVRIDAIAEGDKYIIEIMDEGRGMTKAQIASIGAYQQFDRDLYEQQGAGLGLSIVKKIMDLHSLEMDIVSDQGAGCKIVLKMEIAR
jgi:DNA-binding response OmpR family regulator/anti-sigma regulatory factor (Ser/Thr protein kinase)